MNGLICTMVDLLSCAVVKGVAKPTAGENITAGSGGGGVVPNLTK